jgi:hypothetical protein
MTKTSYIRLVSLLPNNIIIERGGSKRSRTMLTATITFRGNTFGFALSHQRLENHPA